VPRSILDSKEPRSFSDSVRGRGKPSIRSSNEGTGSNEIRASSGRDVVGLSDNFEADGMLRVSIRRCKGELGLEILEAREGVTVAVWLEMSRVRWLDFFRVGASLARGAQSAKKG
jgi:hypothetical protein